MSRLFVIFLVLLGTRVPQETLTVRKAVGTGAVTSSPTLPSTVSSCSGCLTFSGGTDVVIHYNTSGPTAACEDTTYSSALSPATTTTYYWVGCKANGTVSEQFSGTLTISGGGGSVSYDTAVPGGCGGTGRSPCASDTTNTPVVITVADNANRQLLVVFGAVGTSTTDMPEVSSILCGTTTGFPTGATTMTLVSGSRATTSPTSYYYLEWYQYPNGTQPPTGSVSCQATLVSSFSQSTNESLIMGLVSLYGVNQTTAVRASSVAVNGGNGTSLTVTLGASGANDIALQAVCSGTSSTFTPTSSQTTSGTPSLSDAGACNSLWITRKAGTTSAMNVTLASDSWLTSALSLQP